MRLTIVGTGSRGDVAPLITLGHGLAEHGHDVRLLAHPEYAALADGAEVTFIPARGPNPRELLEGPEGRQFLRGGRTPRGYAKRLAELASPLVELGFEDTLGASEGADAVLYLTTAFAGFNVAEKLGIPAIQVQLAPFLRTRAYPSVFVPRRSLGGAANLASHVFSERMMSYALREPLNRARRNVLDLPPLTGGNVPEERVRLDAGRLLGFSSHVVPPSLTWPSDTYQCGYWMDGQDEGWLPDAATAALLERHGKTLFFGLGSMMVDDPAELTRLVVEAAARTAHKLVIQRGWGGLGAGASADHVHVIEDAPHEALFARVDGVVHHGGAGTTARALRAGRPSMAIPLIADQWFWGYRVEALGAGVAPLGADRVTVKELAKRFAALTGDARIRSRAEALGAALADEDAIAPALCALERIERRAPL
jgi:sterol 3beta-glucosyltransferase